MTRPLSRGLRLAALVALLTPSLVVAAELYTAGTATDPRIRHANFLDADGRHFSALIELLNATESRDPNSMPADLQWRLAENYLSFGLRDPAEALYRELAARKGETVTLYRARLRVAEFDYQRGYLPEARAALLRLQNKVPQELTDQWRELYSRVLLADGRHSEAVSVLTDYDNAPKLSPFARYNLGVALINDGRVQQGITILDKVGRMRVVSLDELALRDRANLTLGYYFLQNQQGGSAKPIFSRVRFEGPYSNRALLGLGWAELAPVGQRQLRVSVGAETKEPDPLASFSTLGVLLRPGFVDDDIFSRAGLRSFSLAKPKKVEEEQLKRALVPWVELISRDPMDPAVQEAWLAIPYTLDRLGAHTQALDFYERAVQQLEIARKRMNEAMVSIKGGRMVETIVRRDIDAELGWEWKLKDLPDAPETYFLQTLLAEHRFQEAIKNYRDLRMLSRNLDAWRVRLEQADKAWSGEQREPAVVSDLIERAKRQGQEADLELQIPLRAETRLSAPGAFSAPLPTQSVPRPPLALATPPAGFDGPYERAQALKQRIGNLRQVAEQLSVEQNAILQEMAIKELQGQLDQIENYLVEARFALARLYDRAQKGELQ